MVSTSVLVSQHRESLSTARHVQSGLKLDLKGVVGTLTVVLGPLEGLRQRRFHWRSKAATVPLEVRGSVSHISSSSLSASDGREKESKRLQKVPVHNNQTLAGGSQKDGELSAPHDPPT